MGAPGDEATYGYGENRAIPVKGNAQASVVEQNEEKYYENIDWCSCL
jgi:hypothetical protein